jgi:hypothetical protein
VHAPENREALLFVGSDDGVRVWINGVLVHSNKAFRPALPDDDAVRITLRKGPNFLLLKVAQDIGGWGFNARIADAAGEAIDGIVGSFSPDSLETMRISSLLTLAGARDNAALRDTLRTVDVENDDLLQPLLALIENDGAEDTRRVAALELLRAVNAVRLAPAGETPLINAVSQRLKRGQSDRITALMLETLCAMGSAKTLDIGLAARADLSPLMRFWGNSLVSLYCRQRIYRAGDLSLERRRAEVARTIQEVASLEPTSPWVLERMAFFYRETGDTARADAIGMRCAMPSRWLFASGITGGQAAARDLVRRTADRAFEETGAGGEWKTLDVKKTNADQYGIWFSFFRGTEIPRDDNHSVFHTEVRSDREDSAYVTLSLPLPYTLYWNDVRVADNTIDAREAYDLRDIYAPQQKNFDVACLPVRVRNGRNTITVVCRNQWLKDVWTRFFRCSLLTLSGEPLQCGDNVIVWK